jgi:TfoX/Sxy family transcriptional regulator of competence genes
LPRAILRAVAYDEDLANRIREELAGGRFEEKRMFGGLAFMVGGHMAIAVSGQGGILVRVSEDEYEAARAEPGVSDFVMRGRPMKGWLRAEPADEELGRWVRRGLAAARALHDA